MDMNPDQQFFDSHCETILPTSEALLKLRISLIADGRKLCTQTRSPRGA